MFTPAQTETVFPQAASTPAGNFYASEAYLRAAYREAIAANRGVYPFLLSNFKVGGLVLRLGAFHDFGRQAPLTTGPFMEYHEPIDAKAEYASNVYTPCVALDVVEIGDDDEPPVWGGKIAPFANLQAGTFEGYCKALNPKKHKKYRERYRQADRDLGLVFTVNDTSALVIEQAFAWKRAQYPENTDLSDEGLAFVLSLKDALTVSTLRDREGRLLAAWVGWIYCGSWGGWIYAYNPDPALSKYSLGTQLVYAMIEEAFRQGLNEFDFGLGGETYKWYFATHARLCGPVGRTPLMVRVKNAVKGLLGR